MDANTWLVVTASGRRLQGPLVWVTQMSEDSAPSWLLTFCPQHHAVFPVPSWPASLPPQQSAVLSAATAQVCRAPALTEMKRKPPDTASGVRLHGSLLVEVTHVSVGGLPSCPYGPHPQQYAAESAVARPHVNVPPAATRNSDRAPATPTGVERDVVEPSPSWPVRLSPQQ